LWGRLAVSLSSLPGAGAVYEVSRGVVLGDAEKFREWYGVTR
jgi:hypothetical protein